MARPLTTMLAALVCAAILTPVAHAATFTVTTTTDAAGSGTCDAAECTIREAVAAANAAPDRDTIKLPAGTITLTAGQLALSEVAIVEGAGARATTLSGNDTSRVFSLAAATTPGYEIRDLTVTKGLSPTSGGIGPMDGGGLVASGAATILLERVSFVDNQAQMGGGGFAKIPEDSGTGAQGTTTIRDSTFANNEVSGGMLNGQGGGVMAYGPLNMTNVTVTGNSVTVPGTNEGGGVVTSGGTANLLNVTITGNSIAPLAGGTGFGGGLSGNSLTTVGGITGVAVADAQLAARNTIILGNTNAGAAQDCGLTTTAGTVANVSGDTTCGFADAASRQNQGADQFRALGNYGGPVDTRPLVATSPLLDLGASEGCPAADARGLTRPRGAGCDVGATEAQTPTATGGRPSGTTTTAVTISATASNPSPTSAGEAYLVYGPTDAYGARTASVALPPGAQDVPVVARIEGLQPGTKYHFRTVAQNGEAVGRSADGDTTTAVTPATPPAPPKTAPAKAKPRISTKGSTSAKTCLRTRYVLKIKSTVASGLKVKSVRVTLDGKRKGGVKTRASQTLRISVSRLKAGRHTLKITVIDSENRATTVTRRFTRCGPRR